MFSQQTCTAGTAVHGQTFEYGPNWQKVMPQNQTVYTDLLGRNGSVRSFAHICF